MLVLSRKKNESIVINNDIVITVVEIRGDKVRLGIEAPKDVPVHRQEVYEAIHGVKAPAPVNSCIRTTLAGLACRLVPVPKASSRVVHTYGCRLGRRS